jgi:hypothetical protein
VLLPLLAAPAAVLQTNSDTGEQLAEPDRQRISWVVERLKLTQQQQHSIARGMSVFKRLLSPVLEELRQLQQQGDTCVSPCASTSTGMSNATADAAQQYNSSSARRQALELQEQRSGRMKMLLRKVCMSNAVSCCSVSCQIRHVQYYISFGAHCQRCSSAYWQPASHALRQVMMSPMCTCMSARSQNLCSFDFLLTLLLLLLLLVLLPLPPLLHCCSCCRITSCAHGSPATSTASCHGCSWRACT